MRYIRQITFLATFCILTMGGDADVGKTEQERAALEKEIQEIWENNRDNIDDTQVFDGTHQFNEDSFLQEKLAQEAAAAPVEKQKLANDVAAAPVEKQKSEKPAKNLYRRKKVDETVLINGPTKQRKHS